VSQLAPIDPSKIPEDVIERAMEQLTPSDLFHIKQMLGMSTDTDSSSGDEGTNDGTSDVRLFPKLRNLG